MLCHSDKVALSDYTRHMQQPSITTDPQSQVNEEGTGSGEPPKEASKSWQFLSTVGFSFGIVALQMGQGVLLARLLGPEGRGEYATAVLYAQMLLYVGVFGGIEVVCRYAAAGQVEEAPLRRAALRLGLTTGVVTMVVAIALSMLALPEAKQFLIPMAVLCSLSVVGQHVMLIMTAVDRGSEKFNAYNWRRLIAAAAFPLLLLVAICFVEINVQVAAMLFVVASLITMVTCLVGLRRPVRGPSHPAVRELLSEGRPYAFSMLITDLFERLDLLLVLWLVPLIDQGFYAAMAPVVYPLTVIPNTLGVFLFNEGANQNRRLTTKDVHRVLGTSIAVQTLCTIAFMLLVGPVVVLLYTDKFEPAIIFALWLAPVSAIRGILQGLDSYLKGRGRPLSAVRARMVAAVVMIIATFFLFDQFGAVSIAMAALLGQVVCLVWLAAIVYAEVGSTSINDEFPSED